MRLLDRFTGGVTYNDYDDPEIWRRLQPAVREAIDKSVNDLAFGGPLTTEQYHYTRGFIMGMGEVLKLSRDLQKEDK